MKQWQAFLNKSITRPDQLAADHRVEIKALDRVINTYPMRINPYYYSLISKPGDAIWRQAVPSPLETEDTVCLADPLDEENRSPVPNLVHKYPDRVLFLVHNQCAVYCRFCTRKRKVGTKEMRISKETIKAGLEYMRQTPAIRDVLVSGGDPLLLEDNKLKNILDGLRSIPSIEIIRIGSRVPCTLPMRVTQNNAGIPLGNQTVLLKGVNDSPEIIKDLMHKLLKIRVRPYYLFQTDMTRGTNHFRTSIEKGLEIMQNLIGHTSGLAVPTYAVDAPGGGGKIPLQPNYVSGLGKQLTFQNYCGVNCSYDNPY
jgi:lysine 2,3-aminomutase